jgi:putative transcriptional regulator
MKKQAVQYNRIKGALADATVSNKELAQAIGVTETTVSFWCTNGRQPSIETLFGIAEYLKIDVRDLLAPNKHARSGK